MSDRRSKKRSVGVDLFHASVLLFAVTLVLVLGAWSEWRRTGAAALNHGDLYVPAVFLVDDSNTPEDRTDARAGGVPVLCYHYFRPGLNTDRLVRVLGAVLLNLPTISGKDFWTTTVPAFEQHLRYLRDRGYESIGLDELTDWMDGEGDIPPRSVVITIDDGDRSFVEHAVPVLRRYGYRATVFAITGRVGREDWNDLDIAGWQILRELENEGIIRVESHTHAMHSKVRSGGRNIARFLVESRDRNGRPSLESPLGEDLRASRDAILNELGHESRFLAWPYGAASDEVDSLACSLGFRRTLSLRPYRNSPAQLDSLSARTLGRYAITARTSLRAFHFMVGGEDAGSRPTALRSPIERSVGPGRRLVLSTGSVHDPFVGLPDGTVLPQSDDLLRSDGVRLARGLAAPGGSRGDRAGHRGPHVR